jgi:hypothetical protein
MTRFLPPRPNLEHLKHEAKSLHKAHRQRQPDVCPVLRHVHRFSQASNEDIFATSVSLTECQFALAQEYGFAGWQALRRTVQQFTTSDDYQPAAGSDALMLPDVPPGLGKGDRYAAAFSMICTYLRNPVDYQTLLGDSSLAFILQADASHTPYDANVKQLDIGWWPLDPWGAQLRLPFLEKVHGISLEALPTFLTEYFADPVRHYHTYHETAIIDSLLAERPVIGTIDGYDVYLIAGYDSGNPPLLGQLTCVDHPDVQRLEHLPFFVFVPGVPTATRIDRREADKEALTFAVALGRDEVDLTHMPGKSSGQRSWALWLAQLADDELCGPHFYHANVLGHLCHRRPDAAGYLRAMSARTTASAGDRLRGSADLYDQVAATLQRAEVNEAVFRSADGRRQLIDIIKAAAKCETQAINEMAEAIQRM